MKFDFCIGNPPYQDSHDDNNRQMPVYNYFLDAASSVASKFELIHPARFLFNAGATSKEWNRKMLDDVHFKVLLYEVNSKRIFPSADIKGGIAITYRDINRVFGSVDCFVPYSELRSVLSKVRCSSSSYISSLIYPKSSYTFSEKIYIDFPAKKMLFTPGNEYILGSNVFDKLPEVFSDVVDSNHDIGLYGILNHSRVLKYISKVYLMPFVNLFKFKVIVPQANGSGSFGKVLGSCFIGKPSFGYTQSFISIGCFDTVDEANHCLSYVSTKFARAMLGTLKITQNNASSAVWSNVPLQDFTDKSDIDWSKSVPEIDLQLYRKYGLSDEEIQFIEEKIKPME